jgi:hypothetical protein
MCSLNEASHHIPKNPSLVQPHSLFTSTSDFFDIISAISFLHRCEFMLIPLSMQTRLVDNGLFDISSIIPSRCLAKQPLVLLRCPRWAVATLPRILPSPNRPRSRHIT